MAASTMTTAGLTMGSSCRTSRSSARVAQPSARFMTVRPRLPQARQRCGPAMFQSPNRSCSAQYGPFTFQSGWGGMGGPAFNGDYQAAAKKWANVAKEMEKAFAASGARVRPGAFTDMMNMAGAVEDAMGTLALPVDLEETEDAFILRADVPGMEKADLSIKVNAQDRNLTISGERRRPAAEVGPEVKGETAASSADADGESSDAGAGPQSGSGSEEPQRKQRFERRMGKFQRKFSLPENADLEAVSARVEKGVLMLRIAKTPEIRPDIRDVLIY